MLHAVEQLQEVQEGDAIQIGRSDSDDSVSLPPASSSGEKALATPAVRRIASEYKVDLKHVQGTGKDGRVLKEDILAYVNNTTARSSQESPRPAVSARAPSAATIAPPTPAAIPVLPPVNRAQPDRKEAIKGYTRTMIKTMTAANVS